MPEPPPSEHVSAAEESRARRRRARRRRRRSAAAIFVLLAALLAGLGFLASQVYREVVALRSAPHDNVQWSLAQVEVDALQLELTAERAEAGRADLADVRQRFDLLYSRVATIRDGDVFAELRSDPDVRASLAEIDDALDQMILIVDADDEAMRNGLTVITVLGEGLRRTTRDLSLEAVRLFSRSSDQRREDFQSLVLWFGAAAGALILILAATLVVLLRQIWISNAALARVGRQQSRLASMVEASQDAIVVIDHGGRILEINSAAERMLGHRRDDVAGRDMAALMVPPVLREQHRMGFARHLRTGAKTVVDGGRVRMQAMRADGTVFPAELSIGSAVGEAGPIFVGFLRDISQMVSSEQELRRARDEAMAADRAKSEFIAVMSHEMRTPLNGVLGLLDLLRGTTLDAKQARYVETASSSGELLLHHVSDVLDIARLESRYRTADRPFDIAALIEEVAEINRAPAEAAGHRLIVAADAPSAPLLGDAIRLRQVLLNFVGNAIKFTQDGTIRLVARVVAEDADGAEIELAVEDTGAGISEADQKRIFDDFVRLDASYARRTSGSGLGLAICRRVAESMGGRVGVDSRLGEGSRFHLRVRLPFAPDLPAEPTEAAEATGAPAASLVILMVEDNDVNRFVLREMLERQGHRVVEAHDGRDGVEAAARRRFDLILMDVSMPGLSGPEAARAIRGGDGPNRETPIIAVTAHAGDADRREFSDAGMQDCLIKPVRQAALAKALNAAAKGDAAPASEAEDEMEEDDDLLDAEILAELAEHLDPDDVTRMVTRICEEISAELPAIAAEARALAAGEGGGEAPDPAALAARAHRLAGSAGMGGVTGLSARLGAIEAAAKAGDGPALAAAAADIEALWDEARPILKEFAGVAEA